MDIDPKKSKSQTVPGKVVFLSLLSAAVMVLIIAAIYDYFPFKADKIVSTSLPILAIILLCLLPKKQRDLINKQIEEQKKTKIGKFFKFIENLLYIGVAVLIIYLFINWKLER